MPTPFESRCGFEADEDMRKAGIVVAVARSAKHTFRKNREQSIELFENFGVEGDAHAGETVQHLWDKRRDPNRPNLRQVHLIHAELFDRLRDRGFDISPGDLGENITTRDIDLLHLGEHALLHIGKAEIRITGLRNPCFQIDRFERGLLREVIEDKKAKHFLSGVMGVVVRGGVVSTGDRIRVTPPGGTPRRLSPV